MELTKRLLFLDDIRYPIDVYRYTKQDIYLRNDWHIVRNYEEFINRIFEYGLPELISFDHDLADEHNWDNDTKRFVEKTGYDCAKWLIDYCMDNDLALTEFYCHSMNTVGKENIESLFKNFKNIK